MKKLILICVVVSGILVSCGPSNAIIMKSSSLDYSKMNGEKILLVVNDCKEGKNIVKKSLEAINMNVTENKNEDVKYKCVSECNIVHNNVTNGNKSISKINLSSKIYTVKDDIILYKIQMERENLSGVDLEKFTEDYSNEIKKSIK